MLLAIDVGNTNTVIGLFNGDTLIKDWRIRALRNRTEDEFNVLASSLFAGSDINPKEINKTIISCVVPQIVNVLDAFCKKYIGAAPYWVNSETVAGIMPILYNNPSEVGADRIVNSVAGYNKFKQAMIIIDFGTATTFDAISEKGEYLGGAITPGIMIASDALFNKASKLPRVEIFDKPTDVIGKNTADSIKSGIIFGYAGLVDGMVRRMKKEMGGANVKVIATGGLAPLMKDVSETIEQVDNCLTLEGLRILSHNF